MKPRPAAKCKPKITTSGINVAVSLQYAGGTAPEKGSCARIQEIGPLGNVNVCPQGEWRAEGGGVSVIREMSTEGFGP